MRAADFSRPSLGAKILALVPQGLVAATFIVAGALKLADPAAFVTDIGNYRLVSPFVAGLAAVYLPWFELTLAVGLFVPATRRAARWLAAGLLLGFCVALVSTLARGIDLNCGCFGEAAGTGAAAALARNVVLLACLAGGAWLERRVAGASCSRVRNG